MRFIAPIYKTKFVLACLDEEPLLDVSEIQWGNSRMF